MAASRRTAKVSVDAAPYAALEKIGGVLAEEFVAVLITTVAMRLTRGSTHFYRTRWDIGMAEWRVLLVLERSDALNAGALAVAAGLDKAAVSRTLAALETRKLVALERTHSRGRAVFARLTADGHTLCRDVLRASRRRQQTLFTVFPQADAEALIETLQRFAKALDEVGWDASGRPTAS